VTALEDIFREDFEPEENEDAEETTGYDPDSLRETDIAARIGAEYLRGRFLAVGKAGWYRWDGRRFERLESDEIVYGAVRAAVEDIHRTESTKAYERHREAHERAAELTDEDAQRSARAAADSALNRTLGTLAGMFNVRRIRMAYMVAAREMIWARAEDLDRRHDLFNAANGVVDLRTGEILPRDQVYLFTKVSDTAYRPDATHRDWVAALESIPAAYREDLRYRFGWALTGYQPSDSRVAVMYGGGANGKSVLLDGITGAAGEFAVMVPPKTLLQSGNDHSTEIMPLKGARLAFIEELPEGDYLNVQTLKRVMGTNLITARYIGENNITWTATHSLFITTNYEVKVDAVDHGSRRRFAKFDFPYRYVAEPDPDRPEQRRGDPALSGRVRTDKAVHEAALAWAVAGCLAVYDNGGAIPELSREVVAATDEWWFGANQAVRFLNDTFEPDPDSAVLAGDVFAVFKEWAADRGRKGWADQTFWSRAAAHPWFANGTAERPRNSVRTRGWVISSPHGGGGLKTPEKARLVTGIRFVSGDSR
jgi:putative DNA primase/helicase